MTMAGRLAAWHALAADERRLLVGLMVGLPLVAGLVRVAGVMRTEYLLRSLSRTRPSRPVGAGDLRAAERLAQLVDIAGRRGAIAATCLRQALMLYWLLRRRGLDPQLKLGVRREGVALDAHAWIEIEGVALGSGPKTYVVVSGLVGEVGAT
jgi:hypothetical protein